ncbi:MAG TPA: hypothetical protein VGM03_24145 [Phycisphaerae bacterium]|jgi:hypothetical protein
MSTTNLEPAEIARRAKEIYARDLLPRLQPHHKGHFVVINVETGEYEIDADGVAATDRAAERFGDAPYFTIRVGYRTAYKIGCHSTGETS